jgi:invasion protein IalB
MLTALAASSPAMASSGNRLAPPMRLGHEPPPALTMEPAKRPDTASKNCRKWRQVAQRLGETRAGATLRHAVVERSCAFAGLETGTDRIWRWPWLGSDIATDLPPNQRGTFDGWSIRCAEVGKGERCALIHQSEVVIGTTLDDIMRVTTHFVIDTIGGSERVLWRVATERPNTLWFNAARRGHKPGPRESVGIALNDRRATQAFDACSRSLCMMEADIRLGAVAASTLLGGNPITLRLAPLGQAAFDVTVPAAGFSGALSELARLKRREEHAIRRP